MYSVRARTVDTAAADNDPVANFWVPSSGSIRIKLVQVSYVALGTQGAGGGIKLRRSTARGTQTSTVTPDIDNHHQRAIAPPSGVVVDVDWSANPTLDTSDLGFGWVLAAVAATGLVYPIPGGIEVPNGTGICLCTNGAVAVQDGDVTFTWLEDW